MRQFKPKFILLFCILSINGCTMLQYGNDPNYTLCKTLENKIVFRDNSTLFSTNPVSTFSQTAAEADDEETARNQATYDKLNCSKYQSFKF